jgi:ABC-type multidrug transport system permease subunit
MFWLLSFLVHNSAVTLFRAIGSLARNLVVANALGALVLLLLLLLGGFVLTKAFIHPW